MIKKFVFLMGMAASCIALFSCVESIPKVNTEYQSESSETNVLTTVSTEQTVPATTVATAVSTEIVTTAVTREKANIDVSVPLDYEPSSDCVINGFEAVMQNPELPTGCEVTALAQTLNFYGFGIDKVELCDTFLPIDGQAYWSMDEAYLGDPRWSNGFGCNASVIVRTANSYFDCIGSDWYADNLTGSSLQDVFYQVESGRPVIVWSTIGQRQSYAEFQYTLGCGKEFYFNPYQHCLTIYGFDYNSGTVSIADPLAGDVEYEMSCFESIYNEMGKQAVVLLGSSESAGVEYTDSDYQEKWIEENKPREVTELYSGTEVVYGNNYGNF